MATVENLIVHFRLNQLPEQNVISDTSGNNHSAAMAGNAQFAPDKSFGACLQLDGNGDFADAGNGFSPDIAPWTISLWFNPARLSGENILYNKENLFEAAVRDGFFQYAWQPHWNWDGANSFPVEMDQWYYATVVFDGQKQLVYRNGVKVFERAQTGVIGSNASKLLLGARGHDNPHSFFQGKIAQFRMYDRVLNPAEIRQDMEADFAGLLLHLPLNEHTEDNRIPDESRNGHTGSMQGQVQLIPDETFGACVLLDGNTNSYLVVPDSADLRIKGDLTLSAWVFLDRKANDWVRVVGKGTSNLRNYGLWYNPVNNEWLFQQITAGAYQQVHIAHAGEIQTGKWYHLLAMRAGTQGILYLDGVEIGKVDGMAAPVTSADPFTIGYAGFHTSHPGKIAQVRLYDRALAPTEIQQLRLDDQTAMATFHQSHPIEFTLLNDQDQPALFIDEDPAGHDLFLNLENAGRQAIQLASSPNTAAGEQLHHLALQFRPGTLREDSLNSIALKNSPGWTMKLVKQPNKSIVIYLWATNAPKWDTGATTKLSFSGFRADGAQGSRGTRVELFYQNMAYDGAAGQIRGQRLAHLNIVNHEGRQNIPLHVGFFGSNIILNDAVNDNSGTANLLRLRLTNTLKPDPANPAKSNILLKGKNAEQPTKFVISFDVQNDGESKEWALGTKSQVANISIKALKQVPGGPTAAWTPATAKPGDTFQLENDVTLPAGGVLEFQITNIKSSLPAGHTNLYLHYENIPGYWEGQFVEAIEKSPLIYRTNAQGFEQVGIGTADPQARLEVNGEVKANGVSVNKGATNDIALLATSSGPGWGSGIRLANTAPNGRDYGIYVDQQGVMRFADNGATTDRMTIYKNGAVGIGTVYAPANGYMAAGSLTVGSIHQNYGGGNNWSGNTAGLMLECVTNTEIAVHDSNTRLVSLFYYEGDAKNQITIGRNMGWGKTNLRVEGNLLATGDTIGVGTPSPDTGFKLHVVGSGHNVAKFQSDAPVGTIVEYKAATGGRRWGIISTGSGAGEGAGKFLIKDIDAGHVRLSIDTNGQTLISGNIAVEGAILSKINNIWHILGYGASAIVIPNNAFWVPSDAQLKEQVRPIPMALSKLVQLNGVSFKWNQQGLEHLTGNLEERISAGPDASAEENRALWASERKKAYKSLAGDSVGLIAQDVEKVLPELVTTNEQGYKMIRYDLLAGLFVEAIKEQQEVISALRSRMTDLEERKE